MTNQKIKKAVIPAAGLGTRFLPATKAMAKEIIPIMDKPTIQFIVEEAIESGIEEILIITGRGKRSIEDHFDANYELEQSLEAKGKTALLDIVHKTSLFNIQFKRQHYPNGLGDAVLQAESFVGDEPFLLLLGDDIMVNEGDTISKQMIQVAEANQKMIIAGQEVDASEASSYGMMRLADSISDNVHKIECLVEKPEKSQENELAVIGRYILTPEIFDVLKNVQPDTKTNEIELTAAIDELAQKQDVLSYNYHGEWYEVGEPLGLVKASIQYALRHKDVGVGFNDYLRDEVIPELKK